jgi:hypothetical protein
LPLADQTSGEKFVSLMFVATSALQAFSLNVAVGLRSPVLGWPDARLTMSLHFLDDLGRSFCIRSASSIAFSVSGSSGKMSLAMIKSDHLDAADSLRRRINRQPGCVGATVSRVS